MPEGRRAFMMGNALVVGLDREMDVLPGPNPVEFDGPHQPRVFALAPTRELALQVANDLEMASTRRRMRVLTIYGGRAYEPQLEALRSGVDVVVGTRTRPPLEA